MDTRIGRPGRLAILVVLLALLLSACGSDEEPTAPPMAITAAPARPSETPATLASQELGGMQEPETEAPNPNPPSQTAKLIFIHHSCGENWLADDDGGLGIALRDNNDFVSDTNYGWGPEGIGDRTDITDWPVWLRGPNSSTHLGVLHTEYGNHSLHYIPGVLYVFEPLETRTNP